MSRRTIAGFTAYESNGAGQGVPSIARGAAGEVFLANADGTMSGTQVTCYRKETGAVFTPFSNIHGYVETFWVEIPELSTAAGAYFVSGNVHTFQPFLEGQRGKPGLPGTNGVATDEAVATNLLTSGTSTRSAAFGLINDVVLPTWDENTREVVADSGSATRTLLNVLYGGGGSSGGGLAAGFVSVLDYGAAGDGVEDDTAAIQSALDGNEGIIVFPPNYTFACYSPLRLKQDNHLIAYGATIRREGTTQHLVRNFIEAAWGGVNDEFPGYTGNSNIVIEGGTWDQNTKDPYFGNVFTFAHCQNITVRDATILRAAGHAFDLPGVDGILIENVWMLGFWHLGQAHKEAVQIDSASAGAASMRPIDGTITKNVTVRDCLVDGWTDPDTAEEWPSAARFVGSHTVSSQGIPFENIQVLDNTILNTRSRGISTLSWSNSRIAGNRIVGAGTAGIRINTSGIKCSGVTVEGNTISDNVTHYGIHVASEDGPEYLSTVTVRGNQIHGGTNTGIWVGASTATSVNGNTVRGVSTIDGATRAAITVTGGATDTFLALNTISKSDAPAQAVNALALGSSAVRPRYVLNNLLDGLTVDDQNTGSITT